jgi:hypothetical protein
LELAENNIIQLAAYVGIARLAQIFYYPSISENNCRPLDKRLLIDSKYFICLFHIYVNFK